MNTVTDSRAIEADERAATITAAQCRSARTLLGWSIAKLASAASVSESAINDFELERRAPEPAVIHAIRNALEAVGVLFLPGEDVRLGNKPATA
jgi:transcriptional regulator with XRE-family HTH domain